MPIIKLENISLDFRQKPLLDKVQFQIDAKERICLVGRNGTGKTCLLKLISNEIQPDSGSIWKEPHLKIAKLDQDLPAKTNQTIFDCVAEGLSSVGKLLQDYHHLLENQNDDQTLWLEQLEKLQKEIETKNGWHYEQKIKSVLSVLKLPAEKKMSDLSGGWRRRVSLARAMVGEPDLLLLDEPTNHLDIESIRWMESHLLNFNGTILCISHDRTLVNNIATRIIDLDRGKLLSVTGNFEHFMAVKKKRLEDEEEQNKQFDKKLAAEEVWIRQGIKARRTRNEGRVRDLKALREERQQRRTVLEKPSFNLTQSDYSGKLVLESKNVSYKYEKKPIIDNFSVRIFRGDRIGIIGPNGCGKSTLLKLLLDKLEPQSGTMNIGTNLQISYLDQLREQIDPNMSVADNVAQGRTTITLGDSNKHIMSYLGDFLFSPERARTPVRHLSGGECNRLLLAKLFSFPTNFLVLDEPTNDLDIETLELLEEILIKFKGTLLLVSHDRSFMDNVITQVLAFEDNGKIEEYIGSYSDWLQQSEKKKLTLNTEQSSKPKKTTLRASEKPKLDYKQRQELSSLPKKIEVLEKKISKLQDVTTAPDFYNKPNSADILKELKMYGSDLEILFKRWEELEGRHP